jgi:arabinogalactan endo-1,4-beta-galactosidase
MKVRPVRLSRRVYTDLMRLGNEPAANIVPGYYENFIRRVIDTYTQGFRVVDRHNPNVVVCIHIASQLQD